MKAIVQPRFGSPDVLQFVDIDPPDMGADDVLVRVPAAALNPYDWHMLRGDPHVARLTGKVGLTRPKHRVAGVEDQGSCRQSARTCAGCGPGRRCSAASRVPSPSRRCAGH
jgi:NADPH:quinone reductase-like Zn-dependent oxidoreductase